MDAEQFRKAGYAAVDESQSLGFNPIAPLNIEAC